MRRPSPQQARAGFSLMELMIALAVIGVMSAAIAPSLSEVLADNRQIAATHDVLRIARRARSLAISSGVAHLLRFQQDSSNGLGFLELFAGMNGKCTQTPWAQTFTPSSGSNQGRIEALNFAQYNPTGLSAPSASDSGRQVIRLRAASGGSAKSVVMICYQPNGEIFSAADSPQLTLQPAAILFTISRAIDGIQHGQNRVVLFGPGSSARLQ